MSHIPKPVDKNATKPIYVITVRDEEDKLVYIKTRQDYFNIFPTHIDVKGLIITKAQATKLKKASDIDRTFGKKEDQINFLIPLSKWVKTDNISFNGVA